MSNLKLRISSLSRRAPWTYKKLWTLQCIFFACLKTLSFAVTICYIYMLKCSYMSIFFKILFIISSHTFQTFDQLCAALLGLGQFRIIVIRSVQNALFWQNRSGRFPFLFSPIMAQTKTVFLSRYSKKSNKPGKNMHL